MMYSIGQKIVYGQTGVCLVTDICEKELIRNQKKNYYVLRPLYQENNLIYAPADSDKVFMRPVITRQEADALILEIPKIRTTLDPLGDSKEEYQNYVTSHCCSDLVKLTAQIYLKKKNALANRKKLGFSDEKYMHIAEDLLFGELACALGIDPADVKDYISSKID